MGKTRNTGKLATQIQFDNSNNLVIGNSTSSSFNTSGSVNAIGGITGSIFGIGDPTSFSASISSDLVNLESKSASVDISISNINSFTASNGNTSLNAATSSYSKLTGGNTFTGTQIVSASVYIQGDLVVQGSSSIQYISASSVSIGTNIVQLNTASPAVRFAGLAIQDSGSSAGVTGSMLWDSCCNRWIYSNPSGVGYSGGVLMSGPRASTFGNEPTLTCNYIAKSGGGDHLYDSCIIDDGTTVCVNANLKGSGTACFAGAVCTPTIQSANVCTDGSYGSRVVAYGSNVGMFVNSTGAGEGYYRILNGACSIGALAATGWYKGSAEQNMGIITGPSKSFQIATNDCANARLTIGADGISVFACQVCAPTFIVGGGGTAQALFIPRTSNSCYGLSIGEQSLYGDHTNIIRTAGGSSEHLFISAGSNASAVSGYIRLGADRDNCVGVNMAPTYTLDVLGVIRACGTCGNNIIGTRIYASGKGLCSGFTLPNVLMYQGTDDSFNITNPGSYPNSSLTINNSGQVGINCSTPWTTLNVNGTTQTNALLGKPYYVTSCSGNVSIVDTGLGIPNNTTYLVSFGGNPAAAGGVYSWNEVGFLIINSQYNGSALTQMIKYTAVAGGSTSVYPGSIALYPFFLIGAAECTQTASNQPSGQIRLKFCGWSNSTGTSQFVYLTQLS